jgi:hypothetical protein
MVGSVVDYFENGRVKSNPVHESEVFLDQLFKNCASLNAKPSGNTLGLFLEALSSDLGREES